LYDICAACAMPIDTFVFGELRLGDISENEDEDDDGTSLPAGTKRKANDGKAVTPKVTNSKGKSSNRGSASGPSPGNDDDESGTVKVDKKTWNAAMRMIVKHEWHIKADERDENLVLVCREDNILAVTMLKWQASYDKIAAEKPIPEGQTKYMGHPEGKRPSAMFRHLIYRFAQVLEKNVVSVSPAIDLLPEVKSAVAGIIDSAVQWKSDKTKVATRCFCIKFKNPDTDSPSIKFIFAVNKEPELMNLFRTVMNADFLNRAKAGVAICEDDAPISADAKIVQKATKSRKPK